MLLTPKGAYSFLLIFIITVYFLKIIAGRSAMFHVAWNDAARTQTEHRNRVEVCEDHHQTFDNFPEECRKSKKEVELWPSIIAIKVVASETHSCIEFSCWDTIQVILESRVASIFIIVIALLVFLLIYSMLSDWRNIRSSKRGQYVIEGDTSTIDISELFNNTHGSDAYTLNHRNRRFLNNEERTGIGRQVVKTITQ